MAVSTESAIRNTIVALIAGDSTRAGITPVSHAERRFIAHHQGGAFRSWCETNKAACLRRFEVRYTGTDPAEVSNTDVEWRWITFALTVAYPDDMNARFGTQNERSRDDVMSEDLHSIEDAIALRGYTSFQSGGNPFATIDHRNYSAPEHDAGDGVTFMVFRLRYGFFKTV